MNDPHTNTVQFLEAAAAPERRYSKMDSPVGELLLVSDGRALCGLYLSGARYVPEVAALAQRDDGALVEVRDQLEEYFAGERQSFSLAVAPAGTSFQRTVWQSLATIAYGATASYWEIAERIGRPSAARAVGAANGHNPISIIVPCHRVIGANGSLTGYAGGVERKLTLLELERKVAAAN